MQLKLFDALSDGVLYFDIRTFEFFSEFEFRASNFIQGAGLLCTRWIPYKSVFTFLAPRQSYIPNRNHLNLFCISFETRSPILPMKIFSDLRHILGSLV